MDRFQRFFRFGAVRYRFASCILWCVWCAANKCCWSQTNPFYNDMVISTGIDLEVCLIVREKGGANVAWLGHSHLFPAPSVFLRNYALHVKEGWADNEGWEVIFNVPIVKHQLRLVFPATHRRFHNLYTLTTVVCDNDLLKPRWFLGNLFVN